jgi:hypothetical protein
MEDFMKNVQIFVALFFIVGSFMSCDMDSIKGNKDHYFENEEAIKSHSDDCLFVKSVSNNYGSIYNIKAESFSGIKTIRTINRNDRFNITLAIKSGYFKIVLTNGDDLIMVTDKDINGIIDLSTMNIKDGKYKVRIVGASAEIDLQIDFDIFP